MLAPPGLLSQKGEERRLLGSSRYRFNLYQKEEVSAHLKKVSSVLGLRERRRRRRLTMRNQRTTGCLASRAQEPDQGDMALAFIAIPIYLVPKIKKQHSLEEDASALGPRGEENTVD